MNLDGGRRAGARVSRRPGPQSGQIVILTGAQGAGKTTTCLRLLDRVRELGLDCAGICCPARLADGVKRGIDVVDARTQERRRLAEIDELPGTLRLGPYRFDPEAIAWGTSRLAVACPCDVLVVDEIGPLELAHGEGWANAIEVLRAGEYRVAVAVVRPSLVDALRAAVGTSGAARLRACVGPGPKAVSDVLALVEHAAVPAPQARLAPHEETT